MDLIKKYLKEAESKKKLITEGAKISKETKDDLKRAWSVFSEEFQGWFSGMTSILEDEMNDDEDSDASNLLDEVYAFEKAFKRLGSKIK